VLAVGVAASLFHLEVSEVPTLYRYALSALAMCATLAPRPALAWDAPAGSPPGWEPLWVRTTEVTDVFVHADGDQSFGQADPSTYFRVDAPEQEGRLWGYDPSASTWGWLPRIHTTVATEPTPEEIEASRRPPEPRAYLYARAPDIAPRLDCIIARESGWDPSQTNLRSRAAGLAQFLATTWASTPQGQLGKSPYEPLANIDAAIWLARTKGWTQWQVYTAGFCH
jgi:hypothetical protein